MADFMKFRSALSGFKRSDVTNYIESLCSGHSLTTKKLEEEKEALSAQLAEQISATQTAEQKLAETESALTAAEEALTEALTMLEEAQKPDPQPDYTSLELEAYRRAEATERLASERAARLQLKLDDLIAGVSARYEQSGQEVQVLSEDLRNNLQRLTEVLADLELAFEDTTTGFENLDDEELPTV